MPGGSAPSESQAWQVKFWELCLATAMGTAFRVPSAARKHLRWPSLAVRCRVRV